MCEKRIARLTKGQKKSQQREARRNQRLRQPSPVEDSSPLSPYLDEGSQTRVLLALKTVTLFRRNELILQKMHDLKQETYNLISTVPDSPEGDKILAENIQTYCSLLLQTQQLQVQHREIFEYLQCPEGLMR